WIECERSPVAVRGRERVGRVVAAHCAELEAVLLQEVAALDALALPVGRVAFQASERVQIVLGFFLVGGAFFAGCLRFGRFVARRRGRRFGLGVLLLALLVALLVAAVGATIFERGVGWLARRRGEHRGSTREPERQGEDHRRRARQGWKIVALAHRAWQGMS